jgi:thiol:disulfide interchange protein/DsbC/DsbD-like thiol-disulfide interchange protein
MRIFRFLFVLLTLSFLQVRAEPVVTDYVTAELISENETIRGGESFWVALRLEMEEHWHTYWKNPGDSGLASTIEWDLPEGFSAGAIVWPTPKKIELPPFMTYGYEGEVFLLARVTAPTVLEEGQEITLQARVDWLACKEYCIPGEANLSVVLRATDEEKVIDTRWKESFAQARLNIPVENVGWPVEVSREEGKIALSISLPDEANVNEETVYFFAEEADVIEPAAPQEVSFDGKHLQVLLTPLGDLEEPVSSLKGVLFSSDGFGEGIPLNAVVLSAEIGEGGSMTAVQNGSLSTSGSEISIWLAIALALVGGLILNLMPCVFPILSIKILSFVQQSGEDHSKVVKHGVVFALGVLASFWVLAGLLIFLRSQGEALGWGYQLQSPPFVMVIGGLLFVLALSLLGVFEVGGSLISLAGKTKGEGYSGSFFTGILATIVATPCTAPLMGVALSFALTQPAVVSVIVFSALGIGMAAPYLILSISPSLLRLLPRPGAWMETFKQVMAFPLIATLIWLILVLGYQIGIDGVFRFLIALLALAIASWMMGRWNVPVKKTWVRNIAKVWVFLFILLALWLGKEASTFQNNEATSVSGADSHGIQWEVYSDEKLTKLRNAGKPVFIDFTAAWCLTCKANELAVFSSTEVRERFEELGFTMLKADWTRRNSEITEALARYGRTGVPLYVIYGSRSEDDPVILPQILTPGIVLEKLSRL